MLIKILSQIFNKVKLSIERTKGVNIISLCNFEAYDNYFNWTREHEIPYIYNIKKKLIDYVDILKFIYAFIDLNP